MKGLGKRLPKLFGGGGGVKRSNADREEDAVKPQPPPQQQVNAEEANNESSSSSVGGGKGGGAFAALTKRLSHHTSMGGGESKKKSTNAPPVVFDGAAQAPPLPPKETTRRTANVPATSVADIKAPPQQQTAKEPQGRRTFNIAPVSFIAEAIQTKRTSHAPSTSAASFSGMGLDTSRSAMHEPSMASLENLDDFSLRRILDKRLFYPDANFTETLAVIRLLPIANSLATLKALTQKEDRRKKELAIALTRGPEYALHVITTSASTVVAVAWSAPLRSLLAVREIKRGHVVLQFQGGKERKIAPVDESERAWLFYCISRVCREYAGTDPTMLTLSTLRSNPISEDVINARCPFLLRQPAPEKQTKKKTGSPIKTKTTDISFAGATEWFEDLNGGLEEEEAVAESFRKLLENRRASLLVSSEEAKILDSTLQPKTEKETCEETIARVRKEVAKLEEETLAELRSWESGQGPALKSRTLVDLDHGRKGDPIASLIAHLESVDQSLNELERWMQDHDNSVATMTAVARKIESEVKRMRDEFAAKEKLAQHLGELLEDISPEDDRTLHDLNSLFPVVQRELEGFQKGQPATQSILKACRAAVAVREKGGGDSKLSARKERYTRASTLCETVSHKLSELLQTRLEYYYRFERADAREAHSRLAMYAPLLVCIQSLNPAALRDVISKYEREASAFMRLEFSRVLTETYFSNPSPSPIDAVARLPDSALDPTSDSVRVEREIALKEIHMPGAESRRRLMSRIRSIVEEEDAFCANMDHLKAAPCLGLALEGLMTALSGKVTICPITVAAPLLGDMDAYAAHLSATNKPDHAAQVNEKVIKPLQEIVVKYSTAQLGTLFDALRRNASSVNPLASGGSVFVRKYASVLDRLWAAGRGVATYESIKTPRVCFGIRLATETTLRLINESSSPFLRFENASVVESALKLRPDLGKDLEGVDIEKTVQMYLKDSAEALVQASPFDAIFELALASEENEVAVTTTRLDAALGPLVQGGAPDALERALAQTVATTESKIMTPRLRTKLLETTRDMVMDAYWRLSEDAAEDLGIAIKPSASAVRDAWNKALSA